MRTVRSTGIALLLLAVFSSGLLAVGGGNQPAPALPSASPEAMATDALNSGLKRIANGDKAEAKAAVATKPSDAQKAQKQAKSEYERAQRDFKKAIGLKPDMYRAHNGLGYASRKLGDYTGALESYDRALKLAPDFADAIEYRGEAYLALDRLDDAKQAYMQLVAKDRANADLLMKAMKSWVEKRRATPEGLDPAVLSSFNSWIRERAELATKTTNMASNAPAWK